MTSDARNAAGVAISILALSLGAGCSSHGRRPGPRCVAPERAIAVDGDPADWEGIPAQEVRGEKHLWLGPGLVRAGWKGDADLSYRWRAAWKGEKLYFLFEVADDAVVEPARRFSFLNDCVVLCLDPENRGGPLVERKGEVEIRRGWEVNFLPTLPPQVFLDDAFQYALDRPQTERFGKDWAGEAAARRTPEGYVLEVGLSPPGVRLRPGLAFGVEVAVCDDDGAGRKSVLRWSGTGEDFRATMDAYGTLELAGGAARP